MCKCVLQRQPSEGSWEHPSQPINTLKDTAGSEEGEGNRTRFPLEAVGGESGDPRSVFQGSCWDRNHTQGVPPRCCSPGCQTCHGCSPLWLCEDGGTDTHTVVTQKWQHLKELRCFLREAVVQESLSLSKKGSIWIPPDMVYSLPIHRAKLKIDSEEHSLLDEKSFFWP